MKLFTETPVLRKQILNKGERKKAKKVKKQAEAENQLNIKGGIYCIHLYCCLVDLILTPNNLLKKSSGFKR